jgi:hypothetical protein
MESERIVVRRVEGRYPNSKCQVQSDTIEAEVIEQSRTVKIRIDDAEHPEFWMEIVLEIER